MPYAQKIKNLLIATFFSSTIVWANHQNDALAKIDSNAIQAQAVQTVPLPEATIKDLSDKKDKEQKDEIKKEAEYEVEKMEQLPLIKAAHKSSLDLLQLLITPKPMHKPSYIPLVQHVGIKLNWLELIRGRYTKADQTYETGIDLHFRGDIQLSMEIGYGKYTVTTNIDNIKLDSVEYLSKGRYGSASLLYVMHPNPLTNAYIGAAYGQGSFSLITSHSNGTPKPYTAHWLKLIFGSELRLVPNSGLYGGMRLGIAHLCNKKNMGASEAHYVIPGYGKMMHKKISLEIIPYLKWSFSLLEKKITLAA